MPALVSSSGRAVLEEEKGGLDGSSAGKAVFEDEMDRGGRGWYAVFLNALLISNSENYAYNSGGSGVAASSSWAVPGAIARTIPQNETHLIQKHLSGGTGRGGGQDSSNNYSENGESVISFS